MRAVKNKIEDKGLAALVYQNLRILMDETNV